MKQKVIKRFGENSLGADPDWITKVRLIDKPEEVPTGYEAITSTELKAQLKEQQEP